MRYLLLTLVVLVAACDASTTIQSQPTGHENGPVVIDEFVKHDANKSPSKAKVPAKVTTVLEYVDKNKKAPDGYEGGRHFGNFEKVLPQKDKDGKTITYHEWDVNPLKPGVNRGVERLITGSDGSAHYTEDHYKTFTKIR
jgi:ribonuclease T1